MNKKVICDSEMDVTLTRYIKSNYRKLFLVKPYCTVAEILCKRLEKTGFNRYGWETLCSGITGELIQSKIFMGPTYYQRLKHMVSDKIHVRSSEGPLTTLTHQPLSGRSMAGGLRLILSLSDEKILYIVFIYIKPPF